jgi:hypothetical protein
MQSTSILSHEQTWDSASFKLSRLQECGGISRQRLRHILPSFFSHQLLLFFRPVETRGLQSRCSSWDFVVPLPSLKSLVTSLNFVYLSLFLKDHQLATLKSYPRQQNPLFRAFVLLESLPRGGYRRTACLLHEIAPLHHSKGSTGF